MPKSRKRQIRPGAKSIAIRIKNKIGGRKSSRGTSTMNDDEILKALLSCRKRDRNKLRRAFEARTRATNRRVELRVVSRLTPGP
jgi:hypothetical protein